jgi:hypothetical protein
MTKIISIVGGMQPSTPTIGTATGGDTTASVAFTPSTYIGKGTITYTATSSPGGITATSSTSPIAVTGLTNGTAYTFTVTGTTNYGVASNASAASNSVTPAVTTLTGFVGLDSYTFADSSLNTVTFNSIDQGYKHLFIIYQAWGTINDGTRLRFNGDSGTGNYLAASGYGGYGTSFNVQNGGTANGITDQFSLLGGTYGSTQCSTSFAYINDYSKTNKIKSITGLSSNFNSSMEGGIAYLAGARTVDNAAITSITLVARTGNFNTNSRIALFGVN